MFFGLINSPAMFQTFMNHVLHELIGGGHVIVYLDNILVFTDSLHEHRRTVPQVLETLRQHKLYLAQNVSNSILTTKTAKVKYNNNPTEGE